QTNTAQTVENVEISHMGPRKNQDGDSAHEEIHGRDGLHFHHAGAASEGSTIENVFVRDSGNHAFVPHPSQASTFTGTITHNTFEDAYWWDSGSANATDEITWDNAVASLVRSDWDGSDTRLAGFTLGNGTGNVVSNSVAVGVVGQVQASGYHWPES